MYNNPLKAYETVNKNTMDGRDLEASVLTTAALKLKDCQDNWSAEDLEIRLDAALKFNQRIWSIFQSEMAKEDNPLPKQIKLNILQLSAFIDKRIFETMAYPSPEKLDIIININQNIAAGLRTRQAPAVVTDPAAKMPSMPEAAPTL